ncbi:sensor histidine kinase [Enterococcus sp. LJL128]
MIAAFRKHLIGITTAFVAVILLAAFIIIYTTTYLRISAENQEKLSQVEELHITGGEVKQGKEKLADNPLVINRIIPGSGVYFNLLVDNNGKLLTIDSAVKMAEQEFAKAAKTAWNNKNQGTVTLGDREWQYLVSPAIVSLVNGEEEIKEQDDTYLIRFLDITDSKKSLTFLALTLVSVGIALLGLFFLVIVYFTNRAMKPMVKAWEKQRQFVADASHELKTPLSIITANAGVLYTNKEETIADQIKWLHNISKGAERMNGLINNLLSLAKIEAPKQLNFSEVRVDQLILDNLAAYECRFADKQITVAKELPKTFMWTDSNLLDQLLGIFIDNAYKYTNNGGSFTVQLTTNQKYVYLVFRNSGQKIQAEELPRIFDRFYRSNNVRQQHENSYGLGLAIAQNILEALGGNVEVSSSEIETSFILSFPVKNKKGFNNIQ